MSESEYQLRQQRDALQRVFTMAKDELVAEQARAQTLLDANIRANEQISESRAELADLKQRTGEMLQPLQDYAEGGLHPAWGDSLIQQAIEKLKAQDKELAALTQCWNDFENREAACCPEDVGFDEYVHRLVARLALAEAVCNEIMRLDAQSAAIHYYTNLQTMIKAWQEASKNA
jgi:hypothetical protein